MASQQKNILITGAGGLLGYHARVALDAFNATARFNNLSEPYHIMLADRMAFQSPDVLNRLVSDVDVILHFGGVNRSDNVYEENRKITETLLNSLESSASNPHLIFSNTTHCSLDTPYGKSKKEAADSFCSWAQANDCFFTNVIIPHVFGEYSAPNYNTVTATLCDAIVRGQDVTINPEGQVELIHAGDVVNAMISAVQHSERGDIRLNGSPQSVDSLYHKLQSFHEYYERNIFPNLDDHLSVKLFNTYRSFRSPEACKVDEHRDSRGELFEAVKGGGGGQTFLSWTKPGVTRGEHYHRYKVERFMVLKGHAEIKIRRMFTDSVQTFSVSGESPSFIDMPTMSTHNITNMGDDDLLTLFWAHEIFDSEHPDTYQAYVENQVDN